MSAPTTRRADGISNRTLLMHTIPIWPSCHSINNFEQQRSWLSSHTIRELSPNASSDLKTISPLMSLTTLPDSQTPPERNLRAAQSGEPSRVMLQWFASTVCPGFASNGGEAGRVKKSGLRCGSKETPGMGRSPLPCDGDCVCGWESVPGPMSRCSSRRFQRDQDREIMLRPGQKNKR